MSSSSFRWPSSYGPPWFDAERGARLALPEKLTRSHWPSKQPSWPLMLREMRRARDGCERGTPNAASSCRLSGWACARRPQLRARHLDPVEKNARATLDPLEECVREKWKAVLRPSAKHGGIPTPMLAQRTTSGPLSWSVERPAMVQETDAHPNRPELSGQMHAASDHGRARRLANGTNGKWLQTTVVTSSNASRARDAATLELNGDQTREVAATYAGRCKRIAPVGQLPGQPNTLDRRSRRANEWDFRPRVRRILGLKIRTFRCNEHRALERLAHQQTEHPRPTSPNHLEIGVFSLCHIITPLCANAARRLLSRTVESCAHFDGHNMARTCAMARGASLPLDQLPSWTPFGNHLHHTGQRRQPPRNAVTSCAPHSREGQAHRSEM